MRVAAGTPRWAVATAYGAVASVVPSALWRTAVGLGVPLGWSEEQLRLQQIPGWGTAYVLALSILTIGAALLTLGLVHPWGHTLPRRVPALGGHRIPPALVILTATAGAVAVATISGLAVAHWDSVSGFADRPHSGPAILMLLCYLPALLWSPLLLATTWAYWRREKAGSVRASVADPYTRPDR